MCKMLNEAQLVAHAEQAAGEPVLMKAAARKSIPGEILSQRGLLAATRSALVFVEDELLRPGKAFVFRSQSLKGHSRKLDSFSGTLTIDTTDGRVEFSDIQKDRLWALIYACGLIQAEANPTPEAAQDLPPPTEPSAPELPQTSVEPILSIPAPSPPASPFAADKVEPEDDDDADDDDADEEDKDEDDDDEEDDDADEASLDAEDEGKGEDLQSPRTSHAKSAVDRAAMALQASDPHKRSPAVPPTESPDSDEKKSTEATPAVPPKPDAVSQLIGIWIFLLFVIGGGIAYFLSELTAHAFWGMTPASLMSAMRDWRGIFISGFLFSVVVAVFGGPANAMGCRPPVFWSTLPGFLLVCAGLFGMQTALPDPKSLGDTIPTAEEALKAVRMANAVPLMAASVLAYLFAIPLLGVWIRALSTSPSHHPSAATGSDAQPGNSGAAISMLIAAIGPAAFGCFYFHREAHLVAAVSIALAMIAPSALLAWQGSRLPTSLKWELGGSPAAFAVQGLFVYFTYWIVVRQLRILDALPDVTEGPQVLRSVLASLDSLESTLRSVDKSLLAALSLSQIGVIAAASIGHDAISDIDPGQKRSVAGWLLSLALLFLLWVMLSALHDELRSRYADLFALIRNLAPTRTPG